MHTITFDANGGSWLSGEFEIRAVSVDDGTPVGAKLPHDPERPGYLFQGWMHSATDRFTDLHPISSDMSVRAMWVEESLNDDILEFVGRVEDLIYGHNASMLVDIVVDQENLLITGCFVYVNNDNPDEEITLYLAQSLALYSHIKWQLSEGINLDFHEEAEFIISSGVLYENLGIIDVRFRATLVICDDAVFINHGEIHMSSIRISKVHSGGAFINDGILTSLASYMSIDGYFENNGLVSIAGIPSLIVNFGGHIWIGNFDMEGRSDARAVNNGEIVIVDDESAISIRNGVFINNANFINNGEFFILEGSELIIGSEGTFVNNRYFQNNRGFITIEDGGRLTGRRVIRY